MQAKTLRERFRKVKKAMGEVSSTEEERERVARAYEEYLEALPPEQRRKTLMTLTHKARFPTVVRRSDIPRLIRKDPEFYRIYKKIILE